MSDLDTAKKIVKRLHEFSGADFNDQGIQFRFVKALDSVMSELLRNGIRVIQDDLAYQIYPNKAMFVGVTFEDDSVPTYVFQPVR